LAEALKFNETLLKIELGSNCIGAEGAKSIAEALKVNSTLQKIVLLKKSIGDEGANYVAERRSRLIPRC
jgi:Ran GTPase-activating protein (RanGAP) involved in mRNA processing and transport